MAVSGSAPAAHHRDPSYLAQLTATVWPGCGERLLLLDVNRSALPQFRPGFARDLSADTLVIPHHPSAYLDVYDGTGRLVLHDRIFATVGVPASWRASDSAILAILPCPPRDPAVQVWHDCLGGGATLETSRTRPPSPRPVERFLQLLADGIALVAEIDLRSVSGPDTRR